MTDEKMVPVSEAVKRERDAFVKGGLSLSNYAGYRSQLEAEAKRRYPLTVTRPRVVRDGHGWEFRVAPGVTVWNEPVIEARREGRSELWEAWPTIRPNRMTVWASLLASPLETVDADSDGEETANG